MAKCEAIGLKNISYSSHANKTPLHQRDFALTLVLKVRVFVTVGKGGNPGLRFRAEKRFAQVFQHHISRAHE